MSGGFAVLFDDVEDLAQDLARFALADAPASCSDRDASGSDGDDRPPRPRGADIVRVAPSTVAPPERPLTSTPPRVILLDDPGSCADAMRELIARGALLVPPFVVPVARTMPSLICDCLLYTSPSPRDS